MAVSEHLIALRNELQVCEELRQHSMQALDQREAGWLAYEGILLRAFRAYENFVESLFLSYLLGETRVDGVHVVAYVKPRDHDHARRILKLSGAGNFLDWSDIQRVTERCEILFGEEEPLLLSFTSRRRDLLYLRRIRNHVAHNSVESAQPYRRTVGDLLITEPLEVPSPGELLQMIPRKGPYKGREVLALLLEVIAEFASDASGAVRGEPVE